MQAKQPSLSPAFLACCSAPGMVAASIATVKTPFALLLTAWPTAALIWVGSPAGLMISDFQPRVAAVCLTMLTSVWQARSLDAHGTSTRDLPVTALGPEAGALAGTVAAACATSCCAFLKKADAPADEDDLAPVPDPAGAPLALLHAAIASPVAITSVPALSGVM